MEQSQEQHLHRVHLHSSLNEEEVPAAIRCLHPGPRQLTDVREADAKLVAQPWHTLREQTTVVCTSLERHPHSWQGPSVLTSTERALATSLQLSVQKRWHPRVHGKGGDVGGMRLSHSEHLAWGGCIRRAEEASS
jgi:hypothetical protein